MLPLSPTCPNASRPACLDCCPPTRLPGRRFQPLSPAAQPGSGALECLLPCIDSHSHCLSRLLPLQLHATTQPALSLTHFPQPAQQACQCGLRQPLLRPVLQPLRASHPVSPSLAHFHSPFSSLFPVAPAEPVAFCASVTTFSASEWLATGAGGSATLYNSNGSWLIMLPQQGGKVLPPEDGKTHSFQSHRSSSATGGAAGLRQRGSGAGCCPRRARAVLRAAWWRRCPPPRSGGVHGTEPH